LHFSIIKEIDSFISLREWQRYIFAVLNFILFFFIADRQDGIGKITLVNNSLFFLTFNLLINENYRFAIFYDGFQRSI
jgi:hypothetical protein